jgi:chromosome segregation ATPase
MDKIIESIPAIVSFLAILIAALNFWASKKERKATIRQKESDALVKQAESYSSLVEDLQKQYNRLNGQYDIAIKRIVDLETDYENRIAVLEDKIKQYKVDLSSTKGNLTRTRTLLNQAKIIEAELETRITEAKIIEAELETRITELESRANGADSN